MVQAVGTVKLGDCESKGVQMNEKHIKELN
jgi:hypothetical protein